MTKKLPLKTLALAAIFASMTIFLSCSEAGPIDRPSDKDLENSSSSGSSYSMFCDFGTVDEYGGGCFDIKQEDECDLEWGKVVDICPTQQYCVEEGDCYVIASANDCQNGIVGYSCPLFYENQNYEFVLIGTQYWMAENLNYNAAGSKCYGEDHEVMVGWSEDNPPTPIAETLSDDKIQANCVEYGRLYDWETAKNACPPGWHLPSASEWTTLVDYVSGGANTAGGKLKSQDGWNNNGNGTDDFKFSALPGGYCCNPNGYYDNIGDTGFWWTASGSSSMAQGRIMSQANNSVSNSTKENNTLYSVRCVKN